MKPSMSLSRRMSRIFAMSALLVLTTGCASWRAYDPGRSVQPGQSLPYQLRATRTDSSRIELTSPFVRSDSLYGRVRRDTVGVALADIARLERSRFSLSRTAALVVGAPVVGFTAAYLIFCGIRSCEEQTHVLASLSQ